ncbi:MAG: hypothetical protein HC902_09770, partial [Calothrix sp. SM1_5_4]|nr:hypothetical protein [Calothrix sp. SM1_5_4]
IQAYIAQVLTGADAGNIISSMSTPINLQIGEGQLKGLQGAYTLVNDLLLEQSEVAYKVAKQLLTWSSGTNITPQGFHSFLKYVALYQQKGEQPSMSAHYQDFRKLIIRLYPFGGTGEIDKGVTFDMHEAIRDTILRHSQCRHWCCFNPNPGAMTLPNDLASHAERVYNAINEARTHTIDSFIYE